MKKLVAVIAAVFAAAAIATGATAGGPYYESSEFLCGILLPDDGVALTEESSFTISASGSATLRCIAWTDYDGDRVVLSPKNRPDVSCGYSDSTIGGVALPNWKSTHGSNGQVVLVCNGRYDTNAPSTPDLARAAGGGAAGN
jgi:hypothetical protein